MAVVVGGSVPKISAVNGAVPNLGPAQLFSSFALTGVSADAGYNGAVLDLVRNAGATGDTLQLQSGGAVSLFPNGRTEVYYNNVLVAYESFPDANSLRLTFTQNASAQIVDALAQNLTVTPQATFNPPQVVRSFTVSFHLSGVGTDGTGYLDYQIGADTNDSLEPKSHDMLLSGAAGNDKLYAGTHDVLADGGVGSDTLIFYAAQASYALDLGSTTVQTVGTHTITLKSIENFTDINSDNTGNIIGTADANTIKVQQGNVSGLGGDDVIGTLSGTLDGGAGSDTAVVLKSTTFDLRIAGAQANGITLVSIENLTGSINHDTLIGNDLANRIDGGGGDDTLSGNGGMDVLYGGIRGDDVLDGGGGNDTLIGGYGNDTYIGGANVDTLDFSTNYVSDEDAGAYANQIALTIDLNVTTQQYEGPGGFSVTVSEVENIFGNAANDTFYGNSGANMLVGNGGDDYLSGRSGNDVLIGGDGNDVLNGGIGIDTMTGGMGNDTYYVDNPEDAVIELPGQGTDTVITSISYTLAADLENVQVLGSVTNGLQLGGNDGANIVKGGAGDDAITGFGGADKLTGGAGHDSFVYIQVSDSAPAAATRDTITDFTHGEDQINLLQIAPQLSFIGTGAFDGHAGEIRYFVSGTNSIVEVDANGDGVADMQIKLNDVFMLTAGDFGL